MKIFNQLCFILSTVYICLSPVHAYAISSVPTGDQTSIMTWVIVGVIALIILIALFITRKKK